MGEAELLDETNELVIRSIIYFYGDASTPSLAARLASDIATQWNALESYVVVRKKSFRLRFEISAHHAPDLQPEAVWYNDNPQLNYFRIEEFVVGNISFVDGIGSNTGYFKLENLLQTPTTAAHEFGHTIGLVHPEDPDIRGGKPAGIMYPRGTLCDPHLQYDPTAEAGAYGGFLDPRHRLVSVQDIDDLRLHKLSFDGNNRAIVGDFSSVYHERHSNY